MTNFEIGITIFFSLAVVFYLIQPFLSADDLIPGSELTSRSELNFPDLGDNLANKDRAQLLLTELEELKELHARGALSEQEFIEHRELLLKDAQEVI